jgi:4-hydroxy-3-polyprenylbenzoate decarboxylase
MNNKLQSINTLTLGISGASGMLYGFRLLECLIKADKQIHLVLSQAAKVVIAMESELVLPNSAQKVEDYLSQYYKAQPGQLKVYSYNNWNSPMASGSAVSDAMVVCPCSSGCLAAIASGMSDNLLERAADVILKENKSLILVLREMPFSVIHLENMLKLARMGVSILPANPGFYHKPNTIADLIDFVVARILDHLQISHTLASRWGQENSGEIKQAS